MAPTTISTMIATAAAATAPPDVHQETLKREEEDPMPGIKRGIAIGVACSVGVILVALLAFIAVRRRKRLAKEAAKTHVVAEVEGDSGFWPPAPAPEKPRQTESRQVVTPRGPPVEADAHIIHELDGGSVPELPGALATYELEGGGKKVHGEGRDEVYDAQTQRHWEWKYAPPDEYQHPANFNDAKHPAPALVVTTPGSQTPHDVVSPLVQTPYDTTAQRQFPDDYPSPARSPFEEAHLLSHRNNGNYDMR